MPDEEARKLANLDKLSDRRKQLCQRLFMEVQEPQHRLFPLLPSLHDMPVTTREVFKYNVPLMRTDRFKNTFINYGLVNKW